MMDVGIALAGVSNAITIAKQLLAVKGIAKDAEAKLLVADLQLQLADVKMRMAELMEEKLALAEELRVATSQVPEVVFKDGLYYKPDGDGPFCTTCYDRTKELIRVAEQAPMLHAVGRWRCGSCTTKYSPKQSSAFPISVKRS